MNRSSQPSQHPAAAALSSAKGAFAVAALFSGAINVLMLSGPLFMLQVYDRVLASRSVPTLTALVVLVIVVYLFQGGLELTRSRLFARIGRRIDARLGALVFEANLERGVPGGTRDGVGSPFRDLDQLRAFLSGGGPASVFDLPWMPLYVAVLFGLHAWLGVLGLGGVAFLSLLTGLTEAFSRSHQRQAAVKGGEAGSIAEAVRRNAETVLPLGMAPGLRQVWDAANREAGRAQLKGSDVTGLFGTLSRIARMALQSMVLALGAYLVIAGEATGGVMIAASIMLGRALAPVELAIAHWKSFVAARQGFHRLGAALARPMARSERVSLPAPQKGLSVEHVSVGPAGARQAIVRDVAFELKAGDALGIIGPSGSGKSTLARALVGLWPPQRGSIRLDGSALDQWSREEAGRFLGYLPQAIELFSGTIAQNIARFDPAAGSDEVLKAAAAAGVDALVRRMPDGFETQVGEAGQLISAGQRQRVALARALFRDPFLVVLDEPNSNLDADGEAALTEAILGVRRRGGIAVVIAHRPSALAAANLVLMMADGQAQAFGPKEQVLRKVLAHPVAPAAVRMREAAE